MRAASDTSWSKPEWMKSANWISAIGRSPASASPIPMPMIELSASGVSSTRAWPNSSARLSVARNTPPRGPDVLAEDHHAVVGGEQLLLRPADRVDDVALGAALGQRHRDRRRCSGRSRPSGAPGVGRSGLANTLR